MIVGCGMNFFRGLLFMQTFRRFLGVPLWQLIRDADNLKRKK
jgi:hypothetical protein